MRSEGQSLKVVILGGTGQVGTILARAFRAAGHEVVVLSRRPRGAPLREVAWDAKSLGSWAGEVDGSFRRKNRSTLIESLRRNTCHLR